jgi:hypothetical protein
MGADRRDFLGSLLAAGALARLPGTEPAPTSTVSLPWMNRIRGKHRAVFDNPRDDGTGLIRAWIWLNQCKTALEAKEDDCTAVVVLRHGGVALAMNDAFWSQYELTLSGSTPEKPNMPKRNPQMAVAMTESMGSFQPPARVYAEGLGLDALIARGGIVLACEFAFYFMTSRIMTRDKIPEAEAAEKARSYLVPGVTLVPSGFFALAVAQGQGCGFVTNA